MNHATVGPEPADAVFWTGAAEHRLLVQHCPVCSRPRFPPSPVCPDCQTIGSAWREVAGRGTVASWTRVHHAEAPPGLPPAEPYVVVLVELDDCPMVRLLGNVDGATPDDLEIGAPVVARFVDVDGRTVVRWTTQLPPKEPER